MNRLHEKHLACYTASRREKRRPALLASNFKRLATSCKTPRGGPRDIPAGLIETMAKAGKTDHAFPVHPPKSIGLIDPQCLKKRTLNERTIHTFAVDWVAIWQHCRGGT